MRTRIATLTVLTAAVAIAVYCWPGSEQPERAPAKVPPERAGREQPTETRQHAQHTVRHWTDAPTTAEAQVAAGDAEATNDADRVASPRRERDAIAGEHVFSFYDNADRDRFVELARSLGFEILAVTDFAHAVRLRGGSDALLQRLLRQGPSPVAHAHNYYTRLPDPATGDKESPDGPYLGFGALSRRWLGVTGKIDAWGSGLTVAVLDTGIQAHALLGNTTIRAIDMLTGNAEGGDALHGTSVASLIAGNTEQVQGLAPGADLLSVRVMAGDGTGDSFTLAQGIVAAVDAGARVINLSAGTRGDSFYLREAVAYALEHDVAIVAAVGNDAVTGVLYPAAYDGVMAVTAVDGSGRHVYFANRGAEVDLAAPGVGLNAAGADDSIVSFSGTSAAVPLVSGALAAVLAADPAMTAAQGVELLTSLADDTGAPGADDVYGNGILDMNRVANRDVPGIYDVAACTPYVVPNVSVPTVMLYVQNRGTEPLAAVDLQVEIDGVPAAAHLYNLAVGESAGREFELNTRNLLEAGTVTITWQAVIDGNDDAYPDNNARMTTRVNLGSQP